MNHFAEIFSYVALCIMLLVLMVSLAIKAHAQDATAILGITVNIGFSASSTREACEAMQIPYDWERLDTFITACQNIAARGELSDVAENYWLNGTEDMSLIYAELGV